MATVAKAAKAVKAKLSPEPVITDLGEDKALIAARVLHWARDYGAVDTARAYLTRAGLDAVDPAVDTWTVPTAQILAALGESVTVPISKYRGKVEKSDTTYALINRVTQALSAAVAGMDVTEDPKVKPAFDHVALIKKYRGAGAMPAGSEEVQAQRKAIVLEWLGLARERRDCSDVEAAIIRVGLGEYLFPTRGDVTVTLPNGVEVTIPNVELDRRTGEPQDLGYSLRQWARSGEIKVNGIVPVKDPDDDDEDDD